ncbi:hypothetical protein TREMEDRAFT_35701 [Tremella mesenterica DSM 1558]|uniref:uncharacterized protein n=1 Tax=Tremella mesenterica (strain ATCC 24925 / CBS 8224 / DSM 1558 / NBRC 9311 / NRRL Y-6157 / RJB 2259-6 / UBC 559-6) TaxID=578456 RepID=UPI00032CE4E5|nr:uncharacterized protein TREMEDRAFT_35701 [Tremella mesenterica DSM 1558]EIW65950.1 hypothetical protein TREMEDRAFT_35701 [Tremella mesenterica DSM 1558]
MGGDPLDLVEDEESDGEEDWVAERFLPGEEGRQHVKKLGGFLRGLDLERGAEKVREARRRERVLDMKGQEFEEVEDGVVPGMRERNMDREERGREEWEKEEIERRFEKRLSILFLDGYDTIDYDPIDLSEPLEGDILLYQDEQENYFDDETPSGTPQDSTYDDEELKTPRDSIHQDEKEMGSQNGQGEYDY